MMIEALAHDKDYRRKATTMLSLIINIAYTIGNLALSIVYHSFWFLTTGVYFLTLSLMRIGCVKALHSKESDKPFTGRFVGILLIFLFITMIGSVILSDCLDVITSKHPIIMITIATYTTAKISLAIMNTIKVRRTGNRIFIALRNISCADTAVSVVTMQRSMLVSFGEMEIATIKLMNLLTGIGVCSVIILLGISMLLKSEKRF